MEKKEFVIGIVGGMGSYATLSFFERILDRFPAKKEWERPRVIIDNRCTMPSRVRAVLYNEKREEVIESIQESIEYLVKMGGENTNIILACNTSHIFLYDILKRAPQLKGYIINIIEECAKMLQVQNVSEVFVIATEGTIESQIYHTVFEKYGIKVQAPCENEYSGMRYYIELVKQNKLDDNHISEFEKYLMDFKQKNIVLGCTEFSALYRHVKHRSDQVNVIDPLDVALEILRMRWKTEHE
ncbi:MAG: aspartate/glutamate racemase family protein [Hungatella sp.]|nr:aspartate/glutamate racemase family protein [Hungatella sp.]